MNKRASLSGLRERKQAEQQVSNVSTYQGNLIAEPKPGKKQEASQLKQQIIRINTEAHKQLKLLCIDDGKSVNEIMLGLINQYFVQNGKQPIA